MLTLCIHRLMRHLFCHAHTALYNFQDWVGPLFHFYNFQDWEGPVFLFYNSQVWVGPLYEIGKIKTLTNLRDTFYQYRGEFYEDQKTRCRLHPPPPPLFKKKTPPPPPKKKKKKKKNKQTLLWFWRLKKTRLKRQICFPSNRDFFFLMPSPHPSC